MTSYKFGDHIEVEFTSKSSGESEWLRVKVNYADEEHELVFGILDSEPIVNTALNTGQQLAVNNIVSTL